MTAYNKEDYLKVLKKVQETENHKMTYYHVSFHEVTGPEDKPAYNFFDWDKTDRLVIEAAKQKGFLSMSQETDWEDRDWKSTTIRLTAAGNDFVNHFSRSWWRRWGDNLASNVPTICFSVLSALLISWITYFFGAPK